MRGHLRLTLALFSLVVALPAWSASLDEARQLHEDGKTADALEAIDAVLSSAAGEDVKAEALDLLGTIALDEGQLAMARQAWTRLAEEYPDYAAENDIKTKLLLTSALLKAQEPPEVVEQSPPQSAEPKPPTPAVVEAVEEPELHAEEITPEPASPPPAAPRPATPVDEPATAAPAPPPAPAAETSGLVLLAARGKPHDAVRELTDRIVEYLRDQGVNAVSATGGIPVVQDSQMVLPLLLQKGQQDTAESVLLLTADFVSMQKVVLDCYAPEGAKLWRIKTSGGTGWKGRPYSKTGITEELAERFMGKLDEKIGGPGLPVTLD